MVGLITIFLLSQLDHFGFAQINSPQTVGDSFTVTIYGYDIENNIYPYNGPAIIFATPGPEYGNLSIVFNSGVWQGQFAATLADIYSIRCQDFSAPPHTGESNQIAFNPNTQFKLLSILPGQTYYPGIDTGKTGATIPQQAGIHFNVSVYLTDQWSNMISSADDTLEAITTDAFTLPQNMILNNGVTTFSFAFRTAGQHRFYVNDVTNATIKTDTSSQITIYAGEYSKLLIILPGEAYLPGDSTINDSDTPGKLGEPDDQYILEDFTFVVYATDSMWNRTSTSGNQVSIHSDFPISNPLPENLSNGEAQFTVNFIQAGNNQNIWAEDNAITSYRNYLDIVAETDTSVVPDSFVVYPNPMGIGSQHMFFVYPLDSPCNIIFAIYDPFGNQVYRQDIASGAEGAQGGINRLTWNGRNAKGKKVASGVYYVILKGWTHTATIFNKRIRVGVVW